MGMKTYGWQSGPTEERPRGSLWLTHYERQLRMDFYWRGILCKAKGGARARRRREQQREGMGDGRGRTARGKGAGNAGLPLLKQRVAVSFDLAGPPTKLDHIVMGNCGDRAQSTVPLHKQDENEQKSPSLHMYFHQFYSGEDPTSILRSQAQLRSLSTAEESRDISFSQASAISLTSVGHGHSSFTGQCTLKTPSM
jgi:hypothetical protein